jgi:hypothetical protein
MPEVTGIYCSYTRGPNGTVQNLTYDEEEYKEGAFSFNDVVHEAIKDGGKVIVLEVRVEQ